MNADTYSIPRSGALRRWVASAAIGYPVAWIAGLLLWTSGVPIDATTAQVVAGYAGHGVVGVAHSTLVHGVAAVALAAVVLALATAAGRAGTTARRLVLGSGLLAVGLSLTQWVLGVVLSGWAVPQGRVQAAGGLFDTINRLDGFKMLALAVLAVAATTSAAAGVLPRWLAWTGWLLAAALVVSAAGYLILSPGLGMAAAASLPLLLIWVTGTGLALARRGSDPSVGQT
jgi:hypothetical protein